MSNDIYHYSRQSDPDQNRAFRGWSKITLPRDAAALDRLADAELQLGHYAAADRLSWTAAALREVSP